MHAFIYPDGSIEFSHILFNMFNLWMFGALLERRFGAKRFLQYYFICGLGAAVVHQIVQFIEYHYLGGSFPAYPTVGASGAVYGLLFAFGFLFPNALLYLYFAIPVKAKFVVIGLALIGVFAGFGKFVGDNTAHFAHLGGMLAGFIIFKIWRIGYNSG
jgi:membrane associated rhomboid family serine protease